MFPRRFANPANSLAADPDWPCSDFLRMELIFLDLSSVCSGFFRFRNMRWILLSRYASTDMVSFLSMDSTIPSVVYQSFHLPSLFVSMVLWKNTMSPIAGLVFL